MQPLVVYVSHCGPVKLVDRLLKDFDKDFLYGLNSL